MNPLPSIFSLGSKSRSRRATVEDYHDVTASQPANLSVHAAHVISPSSSCYSDDAPTPVVGPGYVPSGGQMYETYSPSSSSSEPLPIRAPEHYADHMHLPEEVDRDELDSQHDYDDTPRAIPVEVLNSTTSSDSRRRVTFLGHLTDPMDDRRTNTSSSSSSSGSSMPRNVRGILKSPRPFTEQRLYNDSVPNVIRSGGGSDYSTSTTSSVSTRRAMGKLLDKENIVPRDYSRKGGLPMQDMYFVIPGNAPVIFQDEDGNEIYRVDAVKPGRRSRRRKYIFQDEFGNELCRVGDFGDENSSSYSGSARGTRSNSSSVSSSSSSRSLSAKMVYLGSDGSVTTKSASSFSDVSSSSGRSYDGYRQSDRDKYRRDERPRRDDYRRDDRYERDDRYRRDDYNRDDGYSNYTRGTGSRRQVPDIYLVDEEGRLVDERSIPRRSSSRRRDDDYSDDMYDERDYV